MVSIFDGVAIQYAMQCKIVSFNSASGYRIGEISYSIHTFKYTYRYCKKRSQGLTGVNGGIVKTKGDK
jgi:hypothetical protein